MNYHILGTVAVSTVLLAACEDPLNSSEEAFDQAKYNDYVDARNDALTVEDEVAPADLLRTAPTNDTAQLTGAFSIETGPANALVGEMTMDVDFAADTVTGEFTNAFVDRDGTSESSVVELDGSATFSGNIDMDRDTFYDSSNTVTWHIEADSTGTFTDVSTEDEAVATTYRIDVDINGNFFDTSTVGTLGGVGEVGDIASSGIIEGNVDVVTTTDTTIYDVTNGWYFVYDLVE